MHAPNTHRTAWHIAAFQRLLMVRLDYCVDLSFLKYAVQSMDFSFETSTLELTLAFLPVSTRLRSGFAVSSPRAHRGVKKAGFL